MAAPSEHLRVELLDRLTARTHKKKRQQGVQHAGETGQDHPAPEVRGMHEMLAVGFAYRGGMLGEQFVHIHITNSTIERALPGCGNLKK
jgi:hypothetical protein